jgi:hypothetical protein
LPHSAMSWYSNHQKWFLDLSGHCHS